MGDGATGRAGQKRLSRKSDHKYAERLDILKTRLMSGGGLSYSAISDEFGVSERTARRDVERLGTTMGLELECEVLDSGQTRWRVPQQSREIKVRYNVLDVMSLFFGRRMFDFLEETSLADSLDRVYGRIEEQLSKGELNKAKRLHHKVYLVHEGPKKLPESTREILDVCLTGLLYEQKLRAVYRPLNGEPKEHVLHPYTMAAYKRGLYLVAYTERAKACTTFSLERFEDIEWLKGVSFTYPRKYTPESFFQSALFITPGEPEKLTLVFSATTEPFIRLRRFHETQRLRSLPDGRIEMTLTAPVNFETVNWVLSFGRHVEVVAPVRLREMVVLELRAALGLYG